MKYALNKILIVICFAGIAAGLHPVLTISKISLGYPKNYGGFPAEVLKDYAGNVLYSGFLPVLQIAVKLSDKPNSPVNGSLLQDMSQVITEIYKWNRTFVPMNDDFNSSDNTYLLLATAGPDSNWSVAGFLVLGIMVLMALILYLRKNVRNVFDNTGKLNFVVFWITLFVFLIYLISGSSILSIHLIPFVMVMIIISYFFNSRIALFVYLVLILLAGMIIKFDGSFMLMQLIAGLYAMVLFPGDRSGSKFLKASIGLTGIYLISYFAVSMMIFGSWNAIDLNQPLWLLGNGFLVLCSYFLIPVIEKQFNLISNNMLEELGDLNHPLLRELAGKAPGTFQHSLQLSNLGATIAESIGANTRLVQVGALYHDIGKMMHPEYFIENQVCEANIHEQLRPVESAARIIDHVRDGEKLAKKYNLPRSVTNFISTHHGTSRVEFFYRKQKSCFPEMDPDEKLFRYPGPVPSNREEAIFMLTDSLEASARSIANIQGTQIDELVDKIIHQKIKDKQLVRSGLSRKDIETCASAFKSVIRSIYHFRIEYPEAE